ncbi:MULTISPECIES: 16S rRNA (cytidine(1402)-2'-O)-methyltransferase [Limibacillus]|jgi:16S rRNA (cytidine1402-2'-O)-methyltransferase|uniref:Ribosomal RNA small subunit methyltransferase I n=1 Tax=Limibacillus halophilus TaxID=1579333 RepID=A0A839SVG6_9PROT|nr:16S rRNA (cytidine(1402)-2'-O)-methyltransferase [Limibacillus halophilus]MBB3065456.1 16S rRNA (cytidine1402-2'-O)-methyltransferase [Limibacillus halophilus]
MDTPVPKLVLIATPIGNLEDVSLRSLAQLNELPALACEDTRHTARLLDRHGITKRKRLLACHEHNEAKAAMQIVRLLQSGVSVGLCSDAGTPGLSDPGYRVVETVLAAGFEVTALPGPNAAVMALTISGLPTSSFVFKGFAPKKAGQRQRFIEEEALGFHTLVFYESPHRIAGFLADALHVLGDRRAAVCLELTKLYERVRRGKLSDLVQAFDAEETKGEAVIVIEGLDRKEEKLQARAERKAAKRARYGLPPEPSVTDEVADD